MDCVLLLFYRECILKAILCERLMTEYFANCYEKLGRFMRKSHNLADFGRSDR